MKKFCCCLVAMLMQYAGAMAATAPSLPKGDAARGEEVYARCMACHSVTENRIGPRHCGVFGRRAGSVPGFDYSPAMKRANIVWNEQTLNAFLAAPMNYLPGTAMVFAGVPDAQERADVIAWLKSKDVAAAACSPQKNR